MRKRVLTPETSVPRRLVAIGIAIAALALGAACGGGGTEPPSEAPAPEPAADVPDVDVCAFLTAAEIEEALGQAPGEASAGTGGLGECTWPAAGEAEEPAARLVLEEARYDSYEDFIATYLRDYGEEPSRERHREVAGVGDWAMYEEDDHALLVHVGERVLEITVPSSAGEAEAVALAESAVPRLP